jgi:hypothetical protein
LPAARAPGRILPRTTNERGSRLSRRLRESASLKQREDHGEISVQPWERRRPANDPGVAQSRPALSVNDGSLGPDGRDLRLTARLRRGRSRDRPEPDARRRGTGPVEGWREGLIGDGALKPRMLPRRAGRA